MGQGARRNVRGKGYSSGNRYSSGNAYSSRNNYPPRNGREFDQERRSARKRRRRRRLIKALAAWAVCLLLVAATAFGVARFMGYLKTSKQRSLRSQGIEAVNGGNYQEAISVFDQALEAGGEDKSRLTIDILRWRAEAEYQLQDYEAASYTYNLLMEREPDCLEYWYMAAICNSALGKTDQGLLLYNHVQEAEKDSKEKAAGRKNALLAVGAACRKAGQYQEALSLYQAAVEEGLGDEKIDNEMGLCQMDGQNYKDAADSFDQGKIKAQENGNQELLKELSYNRAVCSEYMQDYEEALELFRAYEAQFGTDEEVLHEIQFLESRVS